MKELETIIVSVKCREIQQVSEHKSLNMSHVLTSVALSKIWAPIGQCSFFFPSLLSPIIVRTSTQEQYLLILYTKILSSDPLIDSSKKTKKKRVHIFVSERYYKQH